MKGLIEGRIVHFVMDNGEHRPAIVVKVHRDLLDRFAGYSNLALFRDGSNDGPVPTIPGLSVDDQMVQWKTSVTYSEEPKPGTWHWIEKDDEPQKKGIAKAA